MSRDVPVPRWPLSELGKQRMRAGLRQPWVRDITAIYCSTEQKAIDGAAILAEHLSLPFHEVEALGENDRSATGFLPPDEFERVADQFFGSPDKSIRGWERAVDAQSRIVRAVEEIAKRRELAMSRSCRTALSARCFIAISPANRSRGAGTSRRMAAATTTASRFHRVRRTSGGAPSTADALPGTIW